MSNISLTEKLTFFESVFGSVVLTRDSRNFEVRCPFCDPDDPKKRKLSIKVQNDICHCWVCGWKSRSALPIIKKFGSSSQLAQYKNLFKQEIITGEREDPVTKLVFPVDFVHLTDVKLPDDLAVKKYALDRHISVSDMWKFCLGVSREFRRRLFIPSFDESGNFNYYTARAIDDNVKDKYSNPIIEKSEIVFNEMRIDWSQEVVLVEGTVDAMKCPENTVPILGSEIDESHKLFIKILEHNTPVVVYLDKNAKKKAMKIAKKFEFYNIATRIVDTDQIDFADPGSTPKEINSELILQAKSYDWLTSIKYSIGISTERNKRVF